MAESRDFVSERTNLQLVICPQPLSTTRDRMDVLIPAGSTVAEHLRAIGCELDRLTAIVSIDGRMVPRAEWESSVPQAGQMLTVQAIPAGGDDGTGKSILKIVAMIGLIVASWYIGGGGLGAILPEALGMAFYGGGAAASLAAGAVLIGGALAINALIPSFEPKARTRGRSNVSAGPTGTEICSSI